MWTCLNCERELKSANQWHNCVKVSIDSLFEGKAEDLVLIFDKLLAEVAGWKDVAVSATQNCIVFVHHQTFLIIRPMKKQLDLKFYSEVQLEGLPVIKSSLHSGRYQNHIRVSSPDELHPAIYDLIRASYKLL